MARRRRRAYPKKHAAFLNQIRPHYERLLEEQGGGCAICGRKPNPRRRHDIDHSWRQMRYRGLLCPRCNRGLGSHEDPQWLRDAADYLERPPVDWLEDLL